MLGLKSFGSNNFSGLKKSLFIKNHGLSLKKGLVKKNRGQKQSLTQNIFWSKKFLGQKNLGPKQLGPKYFGT